MHHITELLQNPRTSQFSRPFVPKYQNYGTTFSRFFLFLPNLELFKARVDRLKKLSSAQITVRQYFDILTVSWCTSLQLIVAETKISEIPI